MEIAVGGERGEQLGQPHVGGLLAPGRPLVQLSFGRKHGRDGVVTGLDLHVTLGDLLGVVERMRVQERPEKLARDVLECELEMCVLKRCVVAGLVDRPRERVTPFGSRGGLVLGDDPLGRVAGPRSRHHVLERPREGVDETNPWWRREKAVALEGRHRLESHYRLNGESVHRVIGSSGDLPR